MVKKSTKTDVVARIGPGIDPPPAVSAAAVVTKPQQTVDEMLADLHKTLIADLLRKVQGGEADAATLNVARQILKDNRIEAVPEASPEMLKLADSLPFNPAEAA